MEKIEFTHEYRKSNYYGFVGLEDTMATATNIVNGKSKAAAALRNDGNSEDFNEFVGTNLANCLDYNNVANILNLDIEDFQADADKYLDTDISNDFGFDVSGLSYDTGLYLEGVPEIWLTEQSEEIKPTIRLFFDLSCYATYSFKEIQERAIGQLAIALWFVKNQYPVELHFTRSIYYKRSIPYNIFDVNAGDIKNIPITQLMFALSSACLYRGIMLRVFNVMAFRDNHAANYPLDSYSTSRMIEEIDKVKGLSSEYSTVVLTNDPYAYRDKDNIQKWLSQTDFVPNEYVIFK